jgi:hypothetical protein
MSFGLRALTMLLGGGVSLTEPSDIETNRSGQVSDTQRQRLNPVLRQGGGLLLALGRVLRLGALGAFPIYLLLWFGGPESAVWAVAGVVIAVMVLALAVQAVGLLRQWAAIQRDLETHSVSQGIGRLVYGRGRYEAEIEGRRLRLPGGHNLATGMYYNFFYLPSSGMVLSAEARGAMNPTQASASLLNSLASANGFKPNALERNRAGRLSPEQASKLVSRLGLGGLIILFGLSAGAVFFLPQLLGGSDNPLSSLLGSNSLRLLFVLIPAAVGLYYIGTAAADLVLGRVQMVEGDGQKVYTTSRSRSSATAGYSTQHSYYYEVGGKRFKVSLDAWGALVEGVPYRAYYTPLSGTLVNIEPVGSPTITH